MTKSSFQGIYGIIFGLVLTINLLSIYCMRSIVVGAKGKSLNGNFPFKFCVIGFVGSIMIAIHSGVSINHEHLIY